MTTSERTTEYWTQRAEECLAAAAEINRTRSAAARKVAKTYSLAASNWRKAAERAVSDDPISRDMVEGNARDGAHFEALAHQQRHELDGTPIPPEAAAYPAPVEEKPAQDDPKRMKSREVRDNWRDVIDHVRAGNEVVVEHYKKPVARIVPMEASMDITTNYGTFIDRCADSGSSGNIASYVTSALGEHAADYDVDAVTDGFRDAINTELGGTGVSLHGDEFIGPHPQEDVDIAAAIERVDFWAIAAAHDKSA